MQLVGCLDVWLYATGWSHVAGAARAESCAVIYFIYAKVCPQTGWHHAWVLHGPEGCAVVSLNKVSLCVSNVWRRGWLLDLSNHEMSWWFRPYI